MPPNDQEYRPEPISERNAEIVEGEKNLQSTRPTAVKNPNAFSDDLPPEVQHALTIMMGIMTRVHLAQPTLCLTNSTTNILTSTLTVYKGSPNKSTN
jgi:hypothetical protein